MKNRLLTLIVFLSLSVGYIAQGQGMGGPPNPPPGWCQQHPNDPACTNSVAVPVGDWKWMLGTFIIGVGFVYYTMNKKMKKSNV